MKKLKVLLLVLAVLLIVPFGVFAEEATDVTEKSKEVNVYLFYGDGCGFCEKAKTWFASIEDEYGHMFELVKYEVWKDAANSQLMSDVAEVRKETVNGVPYIIIGNQSFDGFSEEYVDTILSKIKSEYETEPSERYDVLDYVDLAANGQEDENNTVRDVLVLLVLVGVVALVTVGVVVARKQTN